MWRVGKKWDSIEFLKMPESAEALSLEIIIDWSQATLILINLYLIKTLVGRIWLFGVIWAPLDRFLNGISDGVNR